MKLTPQHHKAIELFTTGINNKGVADAVNVTPECVSRWMADFDFKAALNTLLAENQAATSEKLRNLAGTALLTIENVMNDSTALDKDKLTAAFKVLELTKTTPYRIGSTSPEALAKEKENNKFLEELGM